MNRALHLLLTLSLVLAACSSPPESAPPTSTPTAAPPTEQATATTPPTEPPTETLPTEAPPAPTATPRPDDGILLGAIRWDGWFGGSHYVKNLFPEEWRYRLPFYASVLPDGQVDMASDSQAVMDQEIAYAAANGIDYWIFLMYIVRDEQGNPLVDETGWKADDMNLSRQYYLSSPYNQMVNFALMLQVQGYVDADGSGHNFGEHNWNFQVEEAVTQMQEPSYQTVLDGRPLVYFFLWGQDVGKIWGSWDAMRQKLDGFRQYAQERGLKNPYIVAMVFSAEEGGRAVTELGVDAVTSYSGGFIPGSYDNTADYTYYDYDAQAQADRDLWESFRAAGLKVVPVASMGWDPRPHRDDIFGYGGYTFGPVVERAAPEQLAAHVLEAVEWMWTYPDAAEPQTVIVYAWNELSEGGWLVPTLEEGDARLRAVGEALLNR